MLFRSAGGWRLNGSDSVRLEAEGHARSITPKAGPVAADRVRSGDTVHVDVAGRSVAFRLAPPPDVDAAARSAMAQHPTGKLGPTEVVAPMPGAVVTIYRAAGDAVEVGDAIVTLEAMKMEHVVTAPISGRLAELRVRAADQVTRGEVLAIVEP